MRLLDEEHVGKPGREAQERNEAMEIERMQSSLQTYD